ncbi:hypothetical protein KCU98_g994, partial [Aureobasidium melanogenum]
MPLICNLWPRCRHVQWRDEKGAPIEPTIEMFPTLEVAVYPWRCQTCADLGYPYYVPRGSHLMMAEIAAEAEFHAAKPGDSFEEVFRKADLAAFYEAPKDDYHEGPLGGWGPGAGWDPEIPEYDMSSTASLRALNDYSSTTSPNHNTSTNPVNNVSSSKAPSKESIILPTNNSSQTAAPATSRHCEVIDLTAEDEEVSCTASSDSHVAKSPQSSVEGSGYLSGTTQGVLVPVRCPYSNAHPSFSPAMVASTSPYSTPATPLSSSPAPAGFSGAVSSSSRASVAISNDGGLPATTMGLTLVVNGVTYPRIENGKERWYTQRPGRTNNYSRYSDLAKFDTSKGVRVAPKASRAHAKTYLERLQQGVSLCTLSLFGFRLLSLSTPRPEKRQSEMRIRLVHKASGSYGGRPAASDTTKTERTSTPATMGTSSHNPSASNLDSTDNSFALDQLPDGFDADVGPYDPDNDYFPDENMTDAEAAEEAARLRQEEIKEGREFNKKNHGDLPPEPKQKSRRAKASASGKQPAASSAGPVRTCDRCKTLRKGCDRAVPSCGRCQARGHACVYSRG